MKISADIVYFTTLCFSGCFAANILGFFTTFSKSHLIVHMAVIDTLVERGHNVTIVTTLPWKQTNPKYHHIQLDAQPIDRELIKGTMNSDMNKIQSVFQTFKMMSTFMDTANASFSQPKIRKLMSEESFDLVVLGYFLNDFEIGIAAHFKCPLVLSFSQKGIKGIVDMVANPSEPLYVPTVLSGILQPMDFGNRVLNVLMNLFEMVATPIMKRKQKAYYESHFPPDKYPKFEEAQKNVSMILLGTHFSQGVIRPNVPAVVDIGGIHIKPKPDPLPKDIQTFLDNAQEHGAIYFSLGSNARSSELRADTITLVYNVLSSLKQKIVWKWEEDEVPGNSTNILFKKWLPQDDILAHRNIKAFISHGGLGSIIEAEYHGVPIIGMPLFGDQFSNMNAVVAAKFGVTIDYHNLTAESFRDAVIEVLDNSTYRDSVKQFSNLYRDRPMSAKDTAAFWLEYVIRHKGAKHMQSPAVHMNGLQYYGLDVIGFLFLVLYVVYKVNIFICKIIFRKIFKSKTGSKKVKKE